MLGAEGYAYCAFPCMVDCKPKCSSDKFSHVLLQMHDSALLYARQPCVGFGVVCFSCCPWWVTSFHGSLHWLVRDIILLTGTKFLKGLSCLVEVHRVSCFTAVSISSAGIGSLVSVVKSIQHKLQLGKVRSHGEHEPMIWKTLDHKSIGFCYKYPTHADAHLTCDD